MTGKSRIRVLIAEDDADVRAALCELVTSEPSFELIGAAVDAPEAIELAAAGMPDVVLVDVHMPGGGAAAVSGIHRRSPTSKVIVLSGSDDRETVLEMVREGIDGYLVKGGSIEEIVEAIRRAPEGRGSLSRGITNDVIQELARQLGIRSSARRRRLVQDVRVRWAVRDPAAMNMVFQPIVSLPGRKVVGMEALARFPGRPRRAPNVWFAEATGVGLGVELELVAVEKALAALDRLPPEVYLTVNVSPTTLAKTRFYELIAEAGGGRLVAEITEHALIQDYDRVSGGLGRLRALGMRIAVDDAGAGFASLRHILELSPEVIKLDLTLIRDIHRDRAKQALAASLISFAEKSGSTIVAEGIERAAEAKMLAEMGVGYGQGYFFGRPAPLPVAGPTRAKRLQAAPMH